MICIVLYRHHVQKNAVLLVWCSVLRVLHINSEIKIQHAEVFKTVKNEYANNQKKLKQQRFSQFFFQIAIKNEQKMIFVNYFTWNYLYALYGLLWITTSNNLPDIRFPWMARTSHSLLLRKYKSYWSCTANTLRLKPSSLLR